MDESLQIQTMLEKEWGMFHNVNGDTRAGCQEDFPTFSVMRGAQYKAWDTATRESYYADLCAAEAEGRNLAREKYIRMMRNTDPQGYLAFIEELPAVSEEKEQLVKEIWALMLEETIAFRRSFPAIGSLGRPLSAKEDDRCETSVETYETGELYTYSEETLRRYAAHMKAEAAQGRSVVRSIQENTVLTLGYASLEAAEASAAQQLAPTVGSNCCCCN